MNSRWPAIASMPTTVRRYSSWSSTAGRRDDLTGPAAAGRRTGRPRSRPAARRAARRRPRGWTTRGRPGSAAAGPAARAAARSGSVRRSAGSGRSAIETAEAGLGRVGDVVVLQQPGDLPLGAGRRSAGVERAELVEPAPTSPPAPTRRARRTRRTPAIRRARSARDLRRGSGSRTVTRDPSAVGAAAAGRGSAGSRRRRLARQAARCVQGLDVDHPRGVADSPRTGAPGAPPPPPRSPAGGRTSDRPGGRRGRSPRPARRRLARSITSKTSGESISRVGCSADHGFQAL